MSRHITLRGGRFNAVAPTEKTFFFDFDPSQAVFSRQGDSLLIQPADGNATLVESFFSSVRTGGVTNFVLTDGTQLSSKDFFQSTNPELVTAMGYADATPASSGSGSYDDSVGSLISGVDKLSTLGALADAPTTSAAGTVGIAASQAPAVFDAGLTQPSAADSSASDTPEIPTGSGVTDDPESPFTPDAPNDSGATDDPTQPVEPVQPVVPAVPTEPEFRVVVYGSAADRASWASGTTFTLFADSGASGTIAEVSAGPHGTARLLPDGSIGYIPDPQAADWSEDGGPLKGTILVTFADGSMKLVEVLVVDGTAYDAAAHDDLGGEHHEGLIEGVYNLTATAHDDVFVRRSGSVSLAAGSSLDMGAGDDSLLIQATGATGGTAYGMINSTVRIGAGDDTAIINASANGGNAYGASGGLLDMGGGNDVLNLSVSATGYNGSVYAVSGGAKVDLCNGDNVVTITSDSQSRYAYGIHSDTGGTRSSLVAGDGNDSLSINIRAGTVGAAGTNSLINMGDGDNLIALDVRGTTSTSLYGLDRSEVRTGSGNDTLSITMRGGSGISSGTVNMGDGDNLLSITGADSALSGTIVMGSGNDSILIDDTGSPSSSAGKYGLYGYSNVSMGAGDDLVKVTLTGSSAEALRTGTLDMGSGNDRISFQVTATSSSAVGLNDSARLYMGAGDDLLNISATVRNGASLVAGLHNSSLVDLGDGNDTMRLYATANSTAANVYAYGAAGAKITAGDRNDDVLLRASASTSAAKGTAEADGVTSGTIDMGVGDDTLTIEASASGANAIARGVHALYFQSYTVDGGAGDDLISLNAVASGALSSLAVGVGNATLQAGTGDDTLTFSATATGGNASAMALQQAIVNLGDGNDLMHINVHSDGDAYGLNDGTDGSKVTGGTMLDLGNGDDSLFINVHAGRDAYGIHNSTFSAGAGNDHVVIHSDGANSWGLHGATIDMGAGNDHLEITASTAAFNSSINMGAGNDSLFLSGTIDGNVSILAGDGRDVLHIDGTTTGTGFFQLIDAGADDDLIILGRHSSMSGNADIHGGTGIDVLKLDAGLDVFNFTAHAGHITGLERLDLTSGAHEITLGLNDVLSLTNDASGAGAGESLRIFGDNDDLMHLAGDGWLIDSGKTVTLTETDGSTHDYCTAVNGTTTVYFDAHIRLDLLAVTG